MRTTRSLRGPLTLATVITVVWVVGLILVLASGLDSETKALASQAAIMVTALVSSILCWWRGSRSPGRRKQAWILLGAAGLTGLIGNLVGALTEADNLGELALLGALAIGVYALLRFPGRALRRPQVFRMLLDGVVVGGSVLFVSALVVFPGDGPRLARAPGAACGPSRAHRPGLRHQDSQHRVW